jgi:hypothetical protein
MRIIGITHRIKQDKQNNARPTEVAILTKEYQYCHLNTETEELDWIKGCWPLTYRPATANDNLADYKDRHLKWKKYKNPNDLDLIPTNLVKLSDGDCYVAQEVPATFDGLQTGDQVIMLLGGSGDNLVYALAREAERLGASIWRLPPFALPAERDKNHDAEFLITLFQNRPELFYLVKPRDLEIIKLRELLISRNEAMKARIGAEARLRQRLVGAILRQEYGDDFEGTVEEKFNYYKASDLILQALVTEEKQRTKELKLHIASLPIYQKVFAPITGVAELIAARLIAAIIDIRRFNKASKLVKFCGAHCLDDGRLARRRNGEVANWHNDARQALYLIAEQMNKRPNSEWGRKFRDTKERLRVKHPEVLVINGKKMYYDGHIHKMAIWRTLTRFTEQLYSDWWSLEQNH